MSVLNRFANDGANPRGLLLPQKFNDMVVKAYEMDTPMLDRLAEIANIKDCTSGESFVFRMESLNQATDAWDHEEGAEIIGRKREYVAGTVGVDKILGDAEKVGKADMRLQDIDSMAMKIAMSQIRTIRQRLERRVNALLVRAARVAGVSKNGRTIHLGGFVQSRSAVSVAAAYPDNATGADNFDADAHALAATLDARFVPREGRRMRITPYIQNILRHKVSLFSTDFKSINNVNKRVIGEIAGFIVEVDPNISAFTGNVVEPGYSKYSVDCSIGASTGQPVALISCGVQEGRAPIGVAKYSDIAGYYEMDEYTNTHFFKTEIHLGMDIMHPYCAASIEVRS